MNLAESSIRSNAVAGTFYPDNKREIISFINDLETTNIADIEELVTHVKDKHISGIVVPHAGWIYSGKTALMAYKLLELVKPENIALLGPSHHYPTTNVIADKHKYWVSPLGKLSIIKDDTFPLNDLYHDREHALEVQLPFISYSSPNSKVLPLVVGDISDSLLLSTAQYFYDKQYFLIISTDLSHFHTLEEAKNIDGRTIQNIINLSDRNIEACGRNPLRVMQEYCRISGKGLHLIDYTTSANTSGDTTHVVGYASFWF